MARTIILLAACAAAEKSRLDERLHGDSIFDTKSHLNEADRAAEFKRRWGSWPPPALLERELPSYTAAMAEREAEAMKLTDSQARWDAWMFIARRGVCRNECVLDARRREKSFRPSLGISLEIELRRPHTHTPPCCSTGVAA